MVAERTRKLGFNALRAYILAGFSVRPLVGYLANNIQELQPAPGTKVDPNAPVYLALDARRFRGELDVLAASGRIRVLKFQTRAQFRLSALACPISPRTPGYRLRLDLNTERGKEFARARVTSSKVLSRVLPALFKAKGISGLLGAAAHYPQDWDIGRVADKIGYPYAVFHRECLFASADVLRSKVYDRMRDFEPFEGSAIIMHGEEARETFIDAGFVDPARIHAFGNIRMGQFANWIAADPPLGTDAILFSFSNNSGMIGATHFDESSGFHQTFNQTHIAFARVAQRHPNRRFLVKMKWSQGWQQRINAVLEQVGLNAANIPNLTFTDSLPAQGLIRDARVVCGFNSTTLLEAAAAGRHVVIPWFEEIAAKGLTNNICFHRDRHCFKTASTPEELEMQLERHIDVAQAVTAEVLSQRKALFARYLFPRGQAGIGDTIELLRSLVQAKQALRNAPEGVGRRLMTAGAGGG